MIYFIVLPHKRSAVSPMSWKIQSSQEKGEPRPEGQAPLRR